MLPGPSLAGGSEVQLDSLQGQLEAARQEVAHLHAALAASERQRDEVAGQLAAERAQAAALRAQEGSIASGHQELQEAWRGMVEELRAQLKVSGGCSVACCCAAVDTWDAHESWLYHNVDTMPQTQ
jgi:septal ring factor EnvC (AmiA/AmiB activator)